MGKCRWDELVDELGDAVEHRSKWCGVEAHDGATRTELFLPFRQDRRSEVHVLFPMTKGRIS